MDGEEEKSTIIISPPPPEPPTAGNRSPRFRVRVSKERFEHSVGTKVRYCSHCRTAYRSNLLLDSPYDSVQQQSGRGVSHEHASGVAYAIACLQPVRSIEVGVLLHTKHTS
jgi:hypothetical protein